MSRKVAPLVTLSALLSLVSVALVARATGAQEPGPIDFPTSGSAAAQPAFVRGVILLHLFEYDAAREAFHEAQKADPGFAMAYWGEAMTHNHPMWQHTSPEPARAALARLAPNADARLSKAPTVRERDWLASIEALYGPGDTAARDRAYADALGRMRERYPEDLEATSFYALALLGASLGGRDVGVRMRAAALMEEVYAKNPRHPGAAHYLIHAYDDPIHAPLGLRYADAYTRLAPSTAPHALHVPSRIYVALGMWEEASQADERSARAAAARVEHGLGADDHGVVALSWLVHGYTQQGRYDDASAVLSQIEAEAAQGSSSARARGHLARARAAWLVETRRWADAKARVTGIDAEPEAAAADLFAIGFAALKAGDRLGANSALQQMATLAGSGDDRQVLAVMAQQLEAALLFVEGRREEALVLARQAAVVEDGVALDAGPPLPVKPAHELAGEMLLDLRRPREAMAEFQAALKKAPRRALSLLGLARSATAARDPAAARRAWTALGQVWAKADKTLPELKELPRVPPS